MKTFILLFRGINVGGHNRLPMKEFVAHLKQLGYADVSSYINSGNIVLKSRTNPVSAIKKTVADQFEINPEVFVLTQSELATAVANNPYKEYESKLVHFYFCKNPIDLNRDKISHFIKAGEAYQIDSNVFYFHAPDGIGRSRLVANIEACLSQAATGRNLNTINKLEAMVNHLSVD